MSPEEVVLIKRVIREEFAELVSLLMPALNPAVVAAIPSPARPVAVPQYGDNPFLMSDDELRYAESLLPTDERPILRKRVMAARLDKLGSAAHRKQAERLRRQASKAEAELLKRAA